MLFIPPILVQFDSYQPISNLMNNGIVISVKPFGYNVTRREALVRYIMAFTLRVVDSRIDMMKG